VSLASAAALRSAALDAREGVRRVLRQTLWVALGGFVGVTGFGFLTASAFLAIKTASGATTAALLTGLALSLLAAGIMALTKDRPPPPRPSEAAMARPATPGPHPPDAAPLLAFTVAFVLARYLTGRLRG
jgi:hypothetical protein